jgi:hypothetical protein
MVRALLRRGICAGTDLIKHHQRMLLRTEQRTLFLMNTFNLRLVILALSKARVAQQLLLQQHTCCWTYLDAAGSLKQPLTKMLITTM